MHHSYCSLFRATVSSSRTHKHMFLVFESLLFLTNTNYTIILPGGLNLAHASRPLASWLLSWASPMPPPSEVEHATAFKRKEWFLTECQLCQSLTWCCSPESSPPLSLPQPCLDRAHLHTTNQVSVHWLTYLWPHTSTLTLTRAGWSLSSDRHTHSCTHTHVHTNTNSHKHCVIFEVRTNTPCMEVKVLILTL